MDDIARCRNQLSAFRIKELKDVLTRLGLPKQGKKQVLMDKILAVLTPSEFFPVPKGVKSEVRSLHKHSVSKEEVAKVIDDIYRKLHRGTGAVDLASAKTVGINPTISLGRSRSDEQDDNSSEVRCVCGNSADSGTMIQCENQACGVWQHLSCVIIPDVEGAEPQIPSLFHCESCRIGMGDPFCVTLSQPLLPVRLFVSPTMKLEGQQNAPLQSVEKTFTLTKLDRDILQRANHDLQVWCLLLNDKVHYRMHWPAHAELRVNGVSVRPINRSGQQLLGINGRDDGPSIFTFTREGSNKVSLMAYDARPFCIGVRIFRRRNIDQVMKMIPDQTKGEPFEEALARVKRCINGGCGDAAGDSDSDIEVVAESVPVNLSCPMSGSRISTAGRFKPCGHMGGFDLRTFVELNQKTRKWQCPVCMKNYTIDNLIIDPFFNKIAQLMKGFNEDVKEVELKADGLWRPKLEGEARFREPWRKLDGSLVAVANGFHKPAPVPVKTEQNSPERVSLKIGIKRTRDGNWAINRVNKDGSGNSMNNVEKPVAPPQEPSFSRSTSATDSNHANGHEDEGEGSVNQDPSTDQTVDNVWTNRNKFVAPEPACPSGGGGEDVIVLSSSEDELDFPMAKLAAKQPARKRHSSEEISRDHHYANGSTPMHMRRDVTDTGLQSSFWPVHDPTYSFLNGADENHRSGDSPDYLNTRDTGMDDYAQYDDPAEDPEASLRLFLPPQPARAAIPVVQDLLATQSQDEEATAAADLDGWFSLSLGGSDNANQDLGMRRSSAVATHEYSTPRPGYQSRDSVANTAVVTLGLNNSSSARSLEDASHYQNNHHHHHHHHHHNRDQNQNHRHHRRHQRLHFRVQSDDSD